MVNNSLFTTGKDDWKETQTRSHWLNKLLGGDEE